MEFFSITLVVMLKNVIRFHLNFLPVLSHEDLLEEHRIWDPIPLWNGVGGSHHHPGKDRPLVSLVLQVRDHVGDGVELVPHLFGLPLQQPIGQSGAWNLDKTDTSEQLRNVNG